MTTNRGGLPWSDPDADPLADLRAYVAAALEGGFDGLIVPLWLAELLDTYERDQARNGAVDE